MNPKTVCQFPPMDHMVHRFEFHCAHRVAQEKAYPKHRKKKQNLTRVVRTIATKPILFIYFCLYKSSRTFLHFYLCSNFDLFFTTSHSEISTIHCKFRHQTLNLYYVSLIWFWSIFVFVFEGYYLFRFVK